jgi:hypothetical protein
MLPVDPAEVSLLFHLYNFYLDGRGNSVKFGIAYFHCWILFPSRAVILGRHSSMQGKGGEGNVLDWISLFFWTIRAG